MKFRIVTIFFLLSVVTTMGQNKKSKGDFLFFEYAYADAIREYQKELRNGSLTVQQSLNLADSYFKTRNYKNATETYLNVYKKDSTMSNHYFNKMLQSLTKTSGADRAKAFLATRTSALPNELLENANFNYELFGSDTGIQDFSIFNINANSPQSDFSPTFYKDRLLFSSARSRNSKKVYAPSGEAYLNIYESRISTDGNINNANEFKRIPGFQYHKATPYYAKGLDNLFYVLSNAEDGELSFDDNGKNSLAIGSVDRNGTFEYLLRDLSTSFYYPFYHEASGKLYFAANFEDGYGGTDIYFAYTNEGQLMSAPVNLGPRINTPGNEIAPFIFENSLYFSSDVFYGLGGMDVYKSNIQMDETFSIPINLGIGINSASDDFGFIIKNDDNGGLLGYFSSNRTGGEGNDDIYGYKVAEKPGLKTVLIRGKVVKHNSVVGVAKASLRIFGENNELIKETATNEEGEYRLEMPWKDNFTLEVTKERYSVYTKQYNEEILETEQNSSLTIDLTLLDDLVEEKESQTVIKLRKFYFARGKTLITPEIAFELEKVVTAVKQFPQVQLRIESHTDSRGGGSTNFRLSQGRSDAIKNYLLQQGVPAKNILYSVGYGEDKITNNCTNGVYCIDYLHKQNERSLIVILNYNLLY
ncbi:OmpA family protein [Spongiimicrobium sp. 3-5]|uniref:OmpA family protein n=1 Tax=Spongiimicrobium sp. 3-5 TaxID=3332596 RepID=UPI0039811CF3